MAYRRCSQHRHCSLNGRFFQSHRQACASQIIVNFQVTPFPLTGKVAVFRPSSCGIWKTQPSLNDPENYLIREVVSVMSTDSGHFLLVLNGDELCTIRELSRLENCDFVGIVDQSRINEFIASQRPSVSERPSRTYLAESILQSGI